MSCVSPFFLLKNYYSNVEQLCQLIILRALNIYIFQTKKKLTKSAIFITCENIFKKQKKDTTKKLTLCDKL